MNYIKYQLYLLQIENYEIDRYFRLLFKKGYFKSSAPLRKELKWTKKIMLILFLSTILLLLSTFLALGISVLFALIWLVGSILLLPLYYTLVTYLILPFDLLAKRNIIRKARTKVAINNQLIIIGIAGSYGKTTMKNVLRAILSQKFKVVSPEGNINTAVGLSNWVLKSDLSKAEVLLVEFGEEYPGDNKRIAEIFTQDITIITGINEAHFERMGTIEKSAQTIFEAVSSAKKDSIVYLNNEDANVKQFAKDYTSGREILNYSSNECGDVVALDKKFISDELKWEANISGLGKISVPFLAEYIFSDLSVAVSIAKRYEVQDAEIKKGIAEIQPVEHRLQPIKNDNKQVLVIDDSYNGNPDGVNEAIKTLALFAGKRKIYLTPGLVETGSRAEEVHQEIGRNLAKVADKVLLIKNSVTPFIADSMVGAGFSKEDIVWFDTAQEAHSSLGSILQKNDVILFQNDWGDQYL